MLRILIVALFLVGCSPESDLPLESGGSESRESVKAGSSQLADYAAESKAVSLTDLIDASETAAAQRQEAWRLLVGDGHAADPDEAIKLATRAATAGDSIAMLWTGRAALHSGGNRIEAAAWFLLAQEGSNAGTREDAKGEYEALDLTQEEIESALVRMGELLGKITQSTGGSVENNR